MGYYTTLTDNVAKYEDAFRRELRVQMQKSAEKVAKVAEDEFKEALVNTYAEFTQTISREITGSGINRDQMTFSFTLRSKDSCF